MPVSRARSAIASSFSGAALPTLLVVFGALALTGCAADSSVNKYVPNIITPYRMDIQQGNFVTQDMVDKLQPGQTRDQVRFILGTPLLTDAFHAQRWDYIFRSSKGWNDPEKHHLTVFFGADEKLAKWDADVPPPKSMTPVAEEKGFFGGLFSKSDASKTTPASANGSANASATASATPAGAVSPAAAPAPVPAPQGAASDAAGANANPAMALSSTPAERPEEKKQPSTLRRLFGWMPFVSTEDAAAGAARAASPDNTPMPRPSIAQPPKPPEPAEPPPPAGTGVMSPASAAASSVPEQATPAPAAPAPAAPAPAAAPVPVPAAAPVVVPPASAPSASVQAEPAAVVAAAPVSTPAPPATPAPAAPQPVMTPEGVLSAIERWRAAWQAKDINAYLAAYAPDFRPANNLPRAKWEAQRRERLSKPTFIVVKVVSPQVTLGRDDAAVAVFVQEYESNLLKESGRKTLKMARYGNDWLIIEEISK